MGRSNRLNVLSFFPHFHPFFPTTQCCLWAIKEKCLIPHLQHKGREITAAAVCTTTALLERDVKSCSHPPGFIRRLSVRDGKYYGRIYRFAAGRVTRVSNILIPGILDTFPFHLIRHERVFFFLLLVLRDPSVRILMAVGPNRRCRLHDCGSNGYRFRLASPATVDTSPTPKSFSETPTAILFVRRQFHPQQQQQLVRVTIKETYVLLSYIDSLRVKSLL